MSTSRTELSVLAQTATGESDLLDFKREFSPDKKAAFWAETVKDIVAFANTRGGIIVFGVSDDGTSSGINCDSLLRFDNAKLSDQVRKYTGSDISGLTITEVVRAGEKYPAVLIDALPVPLVFSKVGTYEIENGAQNTAFSVGTIYFRHGSKSEPCTRADIYVLIERQLKIVREEWLGNIRKVVEAEAGSSVVITNSSPGSGLVRITADPNAPVVRLARLSDGYPYRQNELIKEVNRILSGRASINSHDVQAIKIFESIDEDSSPAYIAKPHKISSAQYSRLLLELIIARFDGDPDYFKVCRTNWTQKQRLLTHPSSTH